MYVTLRKFLFRFPPEAVHYFAMNSLQLLCSLGLKGLLRGAFKPSAPMPASLGRLEFQNPVGLGAGFDKNARWLRELEALGFGFVEIGTVTPIAQAGNDKPRLFRLPQDEALINRMGFNNDGVEVVTNRLKAWREKHPVQVKGNKPGLVIGGNIGKNKVTPNEDAWKDYEICFKELHPYVDYFVVNVSSPNTPGLRELQEKESLRKILMHLQMINNGKAHSKPILLKIAPDLTTEQIDDVIDLSMEIQLDGLVISNTTINRSGLVTPGDQLEKIGAGGLSGKPVRGRATEVLRYVIEKTNGSVPVISSGGIFTAADAKEKLDAGAALVQVWTGFIYEGPSIVKKIVNGLRK
ncbi:MAG: quinone-dependent dihydroorotate dehydrogenase [Chitinophagaceae bacterium]|nr:MAG: quinone-dependent dihydroorotate dehydrogenase [Chitinophagaceae bacterium]